MLFIYNTTKHLLRRTTYQYLEFDFITPSPSSISLSEHVDSNHGPSACKADALNQLSYAPIKIIRITT